MSLQKNFKVSFFSVVVFLFQAHSFFCEVSLKKIATLLGCHGDKDKGHHQKKHRQSVFVPKSKKSTKKSEKIHFKNGFSNGGGSSYNL